MRDIKFLSFRLKRNRNTSIINSKLGTSQIFNLSSDSTNSCSKLFIFSSWEEIWFLKNSFYLLDSANLTTNSSFTRLANFNSYLNFLAIFIDFNNSLQRISQASIRSIQTWAKTWSERRFKLSMTTRVKDQLLDQKI